ncbi:hypothetical protein GFK91_24600 [Roseibium aggregatum]|uniref:hypothetical protein n=1 Tax=Roseibium aggregatum TaxID=187304 RepID=UPI001E648A93|nr:hypothetical protein [Roseibium aggregatum]UES58527.1 hypothetical protein GFK91_24600 [Roseibium aggregatum]
MSHCERIAFAMFKSVHAPHVASTLTLDGLSTIEKPLSDDSDTSLADDWKRRKPSYMRLAVAAMVEVNEITKERERHVRHG